MSRERSNSEVKCQKTKEDIELELIRKMRLAFGATLHMLECARDDLKAMGDRMERLRRASELCRKALERADKKEMCEDQKEGDPTVPLDQSWF